jgi:hypothetical protein
MKRFRFGPTGAERPGIVRRRRRAPTRDMIFAAEAA